MSLLENFADFCYSPQPGGTTDIFADKNRIVIQKELDELVDTAKKETLLTAEIKKSDELEKEIQGMIGTIKDPDPTKDKFRNRFPYGENKIDTTNPALTKLDSITKTTINDMDESGIAFARLCKILFPKIYNDMDENILSDIFGSIADYPFIDKKSCGMMSIQNLFELFYTFYIDQNHPPKYQIAIDPNMFFNKFVEISSLSLNEVPYLDSKDFIAEIPKIYEFKPEYWYSDDSRGNFDIDFSIDGKDYVKDSYGAFFKAPVLSTFSNIRGSPLKLDKEFYNPSPLGTYARNKDTMLSNDNKVFCLLFQEQKLDASRTENIMENYRIPVKGATTVNQDVLRLLYNVANTQPMDGVLIDPSIDYKTFFLPMDTRTKYFTDAIITEPLSKQFGGKKKLKGGSTINLYDISGGTPNILTKRIAEIYNPKIFINSVQKFNQVKGKYSDTDLESLILKIQTTTVLPIFYGNSKETNGLNNLFSFEELRFLFHWSSIYTTYKKLLHHFFNNIYVCYEFYSRVIVNKFIDESKNTKNKNTEIFVNMQEKISNILKQIKIMIQLLEYNLIKPNVETNVRNLFAGFNVMNKGERTTNTTTGKPFPPNILQDNYFKDYCLLGNNPNKYKSFIQLFCLKHGIEFGGIPIVYSDNMEYNNNIPICFRYFLQYRFLANKNLKDLLVISQRENYQQPPTNEIKAIEEDSDRKVIQIIDQLSGIDSSMEKARKIITQSIIFVTRLYINLLNIISKRISDVSLRFKSKPKVIDSPENNREVGKFKERIYSFLNILKDKLVTSDNLKLFLYGQLYNYIYRIDILLNMKKLMTTDEFKSIIDGMGINLKMTDREIQTFAINITKILTTSADQTKIKHRLFGLLRPQQELSNNAKKLVNLNYDPKALTPQWWVDVERKFLKIHPNKKLFVVAVEPVINLGKFSKINVYLIDIFGTAQSSVDKPIVRNYVKTIEEFSKNNNGILKKECYGDNQLIELSSYFLWYQGLKKIFTGLIRKNPGQYRKSELGRLWSDFIGKRQVKNNKDAGFSNYDIMIRLLKGKLDRFVQKSNNKSKKVEMSILMGYDDTQLSKILRKNVLGLRKTEHRFANTDKNGYNDWQLYVIQKKDYTNIQPFRLWAWNLLMSKPWFFNNTNLPGNDSVPESNFSKMQVPFKKFFIKVGDFGISSYLLEYFKIISDQLLEKKDNKSVLNRLKNKYNFISMYRLSEMEIIKKSNLTLEEGINVTDKQIIVRDFANPNENGGPLPLGHSPLPLGHSPLLGHPPPSFGHHITRAHLSHPPTPTWLLPPIHDSVRTSGIVPSPMMTSMVTSTGSGIGHYASHSFMPSSAASAASAAFTPPSPARPIVGFTSEMAARTLPPLSSNNFARIMGRSAASTSTSSQCNKKSEIIELLKKKFSDSTGGFKDKYSNLSNIIEGKTYCRNIFISKNGKSENISFEYWYYIDETDRISHFARKNNDNLEPLEYDNFKKCYYTEKSRIFIEFPPNTIDIIDASNIKKIQKLTWTQANQYHWVDQQSAAPLPIPSLLLPKSPCSFDSEIGNMLKQKFSNNSRNGRNREYKSGYSFVEQFKDKIMYCRHLFKSKSNGISFEYWSYYNPTTKKYVNLASINDGIPEELSYSINDPVHYYTLNPKIIIDVKNSVIIDYKDNLTKKYLIWSSDKYYHWADKDLPINQLKEEERFQLDMFKKGPIYSMLITSFSNKNHKKLEEGIEIKYEKINDMLYIVCNFKNNSKDIIFQIFIHANKKDRIIYYFIKKNMSGRMYELDRSLRNSEEYYFKDNEGICIISLKEKKILYTKNGDKTNEELKLYEDHYFKWSTVGINSTVSSSNNLIQQVIIERLTREYENNYITIPHTNEKIEEIIILKDKRKLNSRNSKNKLLHYKVLSNELIAYLSDDDTEYKFKYTFDIHNFCIFESIKSRNSFIVIFPSGLIVSILNFNRSKLSTATLAKTGEVVSWKEGIDEWESLQQILKKGFDENNAFNEINKILDAKFKENYMYYDKDKYCIVFYDKTDKIDITDDKIKLFMSSDLKVQVKNIEYYYNKEKDGNYLFMTNDDKESQSLVITKDGDLYIYYTENIDNNYIIFSIIDGNKVDWINGNNFERNINPIKKLFEKKNNSSNNSAIKINNILKKKFINNFFEIDKNCGGILKQKGKEVKLENIELMYFNNEQQITTNNMTFKFQKIKNGNYLFSYMVDESNLPVYLIITHNGDIYLMSHPQNNNQKYLTLIEKSIDKIVEWKEDDNYKRNVEPILRELLHNNKSILKNVVNNSGSGNTAEILKKNVKKTIIPNVMLESQNGVSNNSNVDEKIIELLGIKYGGFITKDNDLVKIYKNINEFKGEYIFTYTLKTDIIAIFGNNKFRFLKKFDDNYLFVPENKNDKNENIVIIMKDGSIFGKYKLLCYELIKKDNVLVWESIDCKDINLFIKNKSGTNSKSLGAAAALPVNLNSSAAALQVSLNNSVTQNYNNLLKNNKDASKRSRNIVPNIDNILLKSSNSSKNSILDILGKKFTINQINKNYFILSANKRPLLTYYSDHNFFSILPTISKNIYIFFEKNNNNYMYESKKDNSYLIIEEDGNVYIYKPDDNINHMILIIDTNIGKAEWEIINTNGTNVKNLFEVLMKQSLENKSSLGSKAASNVKNNNSELITIINEIVIASLEKFGENLLFIENNEEQKLGIRTNPDVDDKILTYDLKILKIDTLNNIFSYRRIIKNHLIFFSTNFFLIITPDPDNSIIAYNEKNKINKILFKNDENEVSWENLSLDSSLNKLIIEVIDIYKQSQNNSNKMERNSAAAAVSLNSSNNKKTIQDVLRLPKFNDHIITPTNNIKVILKNTDKKKTDNELLTYYLKDDVFIINKSEFEYDKKQNGIFLYSTKKDENIFFLLVTEDGNFYIFNKTNWYTILTKTGDKVEWKEGTNFSGNVKLNLKKLQKKNNTRLMLPNVENGAAASHASALFNRLLDIYRSNITINANIMCINIDGNNDANIGDKLYYNIDHDIFYTDTIKDFKYYGNKSENYLYVSNSTGNKLLITKRGYVYFINKNKTDTYKLIRKEGNFKWDQENRANTTIKNTIELIEKNNSVSNKMPASLGAAVVSLNSSAASLNNSLNTKKFYTKFAQHIQRTQSVILDHIQGNTENIYNIATFKNNQNADIFKILYDAHPRNRMFYFIDLDSQTKNITPIDISETDFTSYVYNPKIIKYTFSFLNGKAEIFRIIEEKTEILKYTGKLNGSGGYKWEEDDRYEA